MLLMKGDVKRHSSNDQLLLWVKVAAYTFSEHLPGEKGISLRDNLQNKKLKECLWEEFANFNC